MADIGTHATEVVARLARIEDSGLLPASVAVRAGRMRAALARPVRVTVFGLPSTGKSAVLNILAGARVLPGWPGLPTTEVAGGVAPLTELILGDGQRMTHDGAPTTDDLALSPAFMRLIVPDAPGLARLSLLEVVTDGSAPDLAAAIRWALPRTDIALWCTERLTEADRLAWDAAPDEIKDHAVMVLTGAKGPVPAGRPIRAGLPAGFRAAWPVWREKLDEALSTGDPTTLAASGAQALTRAIMDMAQAGRAADIEAALMLLARYEPVEWRGSSRSRSEPARSNAERPPSATPLASPPAALAGTTARSPDATSQGHASPRAAAPAHVAARAHAALLHLRHQMGALLSDITPNLASGDPSGNETGAAWADEVLGRCAALAGDLSEILQPDDLHLADDDDGLNALRMAVDEVADLTVLLQIEGGPSQAADAAALMAQLRRTFDRALTA